LILQKSVRFSEFLLSLSTHATEKGPSTREVLAIGNYAGHEGDAAQGTLPQHLLIVTGKYPARWHDGRGLHAKQPGSLSFVPSGHISKARAQTPFEVLVCLLDPSLLASVGRELDGPQHRELYPTLNFQDIALRQLLALLHAEAALGGRSEQLYREYLTHALVLRILSLQGAPTIASKSLPSKNLSSLPYRALRRVLERMNELGDNLSLEELSKESGYSRNHFSRMFQAATGRTPHNYLTHLRLERAQELITKDEVSLVDVAMACGFSSHSHMTRVFRKILGVTPSEYQRHLTGRG